MKRLCKLTALLLACLLLASCTGNGAGANATHTFTDSTGHTVSVNGTPQRVAVLLSSFAEIWQSAGGEVAITVGESVERGICEQGVTLVDAGAGKTVNAEVLIAAAPDLVLLSADIPAQVEAAALLREAHIPVAELRVESFDDYLAALKLCTDLTGRTDLYDSLGTAQKARIDALVSQAPLAGKRILFVRAGSTASSVKAKSSEQSFAAAMLTHLGATNIADGAPLLLDGLSMEVILAEDPDYIYFTAMGDEDASRAFVSEMLTREEWRALHAVKNGAVCYLPKELFHYKPNARWADAYEYLTSPIS